MTMSKKRKQEIHDEWKEHLLNSKERTIYSLKRIDLLIISISAAGIYIIFETLREFKTGGVAIEYPLIIFTSGLSLMLAIISNFFSQKTGYNANKYEEKYTAIELERIKGEEVDDCIQKEYDKKTKLYNWWTNNLNTFSIVFMIVGLILLSIINYLIIFLD